MLFEPLADLSRRVSLERLHRRFLAGLSNRIGFGMLSLAVRAERYGGRPAFAGADVAGGALELPPPTRRAGRQ